MAVCTIRFNQLSISMDQYSRKTADLTPEYLLALSKQVDLLSKHYQQNRLGSLTQDFSNTLTTHFNELTQYLQLYQNDGVMRAASLYRCKGLLQLYTLVKAAALIARENPEVGAIVESSAAMLKELLMNLQGLVLEQREAGTRFVQTEKDHVIKKLRSEVSIKREYTQELQERVRQLEDENSQLYSKLITAAKQTSEFAIRNSPVKIKQLLTNTQLSISDRPASPRKKASLRNYQDDVLEILQGKFKKQSIQEKDSSLDEYVHTHFTVKYGKPMAETNQYTFREAVVELARRQQRHIFMLFQAMIEEQCQEAYFFEDKVIHQRVVKCIKRYLNQRYGKSLFELDRVLDWKNFDDKNDIPLAESDLQPILSNVYKSTEVHTLEMILNEIITSRQQDNRLTCRRLLTEILNYQLSKHLLRVEDIVRQARKVADGASTLTFQQVQKVMVRVIKDKKRYELLSRQGPQWSGKRFTFSKVIQIIQKVRRAKLAKD